MSLIRKTFFAYFTIMVAAFFVPLWPLSDIVMSIAMLLLLVNWILLVRQYFRSIHLEMICYTVLNSIVTIVAIYLIFFFC